MPVNLLFLMPLFCHFKCRFLPFLMPPYNESGQTSMTEHRTMGEAGESLPYERVYQTYRNEAMKTLEEENVPYGMREMVAEYFSALE